MAVADVVVTLTRRPDTLLWSIRECLALRRPFVTSDSRVMRLEFEGLGLFTDHSPADLVAKIHRAHERGAEFADGMTAYIARDRERWRRDAACVRALLSE
jgi:hypothetical protein